MLEAENSQLVVVDIQGKLARIVYESEKLIRNTRILIQAANILQIPIVWVEQNPKGLGATSPEIAEMLNGNEAIAKMTFSACGEEKFRKAIAQNNRNNLILAGMETHVCVYQTAMDLMKEGYSVTLAADAVSSRTLENKQLALQRLKEEGAIISGTEMLVFELQKTCEGDRFKQLLNLVK